MAIPVLTMGLPWIAYTGIGRMPVAHRAAGALRGERFPGFLSFGTTGEKRDGKHQKTSENHG